MRFNPVWNMATKLKFNPEEWDEIPEKYQFKVDKCRCPACGGLGMPWNGWFTCDDCPCVAVVEDGRAFLPKPIAEPSPRGQP